MCERFKHLILIRLGYRQYFSRKKKSTGKLSNIYNQSRKITLYSLPLHCLYSLSCSYAGYFSKDRCPGVGVGGSPLPCCQACTATSVYNYTWIILACIDNSLQLNPGGFHLSIRYVAVNCYMNIKVFTNVRIRMD